MVHLKAHQMNPGALSIEPWLTLKWTPTHFEMNPGHYFPQKINVLKNKTKLVKAFHLKIYWLVYGQNLIFNLGIPLNTLHPKMIISVKQLNPCFLTILVKKHVLRDAFGEIRHIQIQMYPQNSVEPKYGEFNWKKNKVSAHGLGLVVQLNWRVTPPSGKLR